MKYFHSFGHGLLLFLSVLILLSACSNPSIENSKQIEAVEQGLLPAVYEKGNPIPGLTMQEEMEKWNVPGLSVAVINDGKIAWTKSYGVKEAGSRDSVANNTLFQAASISKPVAAAAALRLVQAGLLSLDQPVNPLLKSWKLPENKFNADSSVTLRMLLSHTAGTTVSGFPGYTSADSIPSLTAILDGESPANTPPIRLDTIPGSAMSYSGGGYTIAQQLMMDMTDESFSSLLDSYVLNPSQMSNSTFQHPLPERLTKNVAKAHDNDGQTVEGGWSHYPELAAAGLWTTAEDLAHFVVELHESYQDESDELISSPLAQEMMSEVMNNYGLGLHVEGKGDSLWVSHSGANNGYRAHFVLYPEQGDGAVILTNADGGGMVTRAFLRGVASQYNWPGTGWKPKAKKRVDISAGELSKYVGKYEEEAGHTTVIEKSGNHLIATIPFVGKELLLLPKGNDRFFLTVWDMEVQFGSSKDDNIADLTVYLDEAQELFSAKKTTQ